MGRAILSLVEYIAGKILMICWLFEPNGGSLLRREEPR